MAGEWSKSAPICTQFLVRAMKSVPYGACSALCQRPTGLLLIRLVTGHEPLSGRQCSRKVPVWQIVSWPHARSSLLNDPHEAPYILEWLVFHRICGVEVFRIYDNDSDDGTTEILQRVEPIFNIERVQWSMAGPGRQAAAFEDGLQALRGRVDIIGFIDTDEFLFDPEFRTLQSALRSLPSEVAAVGVNQLVFGSRAGPPPLVVPVTGRFFFRARDDYLEHKWFKTIVLRPECVEAFNTQHAVTLRSGSYKFSGTGLGSD